MRTEAQDWVKSAEGTIKASTKVAVVSEHNRLCEDLYRPGVCGRHVSAARKAKLIVIEKVLFSMAKACAKSDHVPMIMLQPIAGGAAAESVVVMFAELWKKDPPEISIICCALGESLSAGSLVALRDPAFRVLDDVFTTARGLSLAL